MNNIAYIHLDTRFQSTNYQYLRALQYYGFLSGGESELSLRYMNYPPLQYIFTMPFFSLFGQSQETARLSLLVFWIIFLLAMFGIGYELGGPWSGAVVMLLAASSPHVLNCSRTYFIDFPQTAMTALALYFLTKSNGYRDYKNSLFFGLAFGLSLAVKWSSLFFLLVPAFFLATPCLFKSRRSLSVIVSTIPSLLLIASGFFTYFKQVEINKDIFDPLWFSFYVIFIIMPVLIGAIIIKRLEKEWKKEKGYENSRENRIINFLRASALVVVIISIWLYWGAHGFLFKVNFDMNIIGCPMMGYIIFFINFLKSLFNFAPIFCLAGVLFLFMKKNKYSNILIILFSALGAIMVFFSLRYYITRHLLSFVIFASALGGYWVVHVGRAKPFVFAVVLIISLGSILAWTVIPGNSDFYSVIQTNSLPVNRLPFIEKLLAPTSPMKISVDKIFNEMEFTKSGQDYLMVLDSTPNRADNSLSPEAYFLTAMIMKRNIKFSMLDKVERPGSDPNIMLMEIPISTDTKILPGGVTNLVIIHRTEIDLRRKMEKVINYFSDFTYQSKKTIKIGEGISATIFKIVPRE
jgi:4-amino-4-deoxy-L-arabinose transferase-like glycosyltransferase